MKNVRKYHKLTALKTNSNRFTNVYVDTETKSHKIDQTTENLEFLLGVAELRAYNTDLTTRYQDDLMFDNIDIFFDWLVKYNQRYKKMLLYAHNLDFDFTVLDTLHKLTNRGYRVDYFVVDNYAFIIRFKHDKSTIEMIDSMMILRASIKDLGSMLKLPKLKIPTVDENNKQDMFVYCKRDVDVLRESLENYFRFVRENDLGSIAKTVPSQAMIAFRHRFYSNNIIIHGNKNIDEKELYSYHGARAEAFFIGSLENQKIYYLDVNSLYPYVMHENEYPIEYLGSVQNPSVSQLKQALDKHCVIAKVDIETDEPFLPFSTEKLIFPVGRFTGWYSTPELLYGLENYNILKVHEMLLYKKAPLFKSYVDFFYGLKSKYKSEGNDIYYYLTKLFLNALYGKFGQRNTEYVKEYEDHTVDFGIRYIFDPVRNDIDYEIIIDHVVYKKGERETAENSFIAIASHVTAYSRMYMWQLMKRAGLENIYYMDTDSLFVNETGKTNLRDYIDDYRLGALKIEKESSTMMIRAVKDYTFDQRDVIKGVKGNSEKVDDNTYITKQFTRFKTNLKNNNLNIIQITDNVKRLTRNYDKGQVTESGRVYPINLSLI